MTTPAVWHPDAPRDRWVVVQFRKTIELSEAADGGSLWVTASQRVELWLDGGLLARGPSRSDADRWGVMRVGLPALAAGRHVLAARVWHAGGDSGEAQLGPPAFLLVCPADDAPAGWSTAEGWRCRQDTSSRPVRRHAWGESEPYDVVGAGESIDGAALLPDWPAASEPGRVGPDSLPWIDAVTVARFAADTWGNLPLRCRLRPDPLPPMRDTPVSWRRIAQADDGVAEAAAAWLGGSADTLTFPAGRTARVVLDAGTIVNAYLRFRFRGGAGAAVRLITAEAPSRETWRDKPPRDCALGVDYRGHLDRLRPDGRGHDVRLLHFRSLRYLVIEAAVGDEPWTLEAVEAEHTTFPLTSAEHAVYEGPDLPDIPRIQAVSDRTIALCSHELFFDCPHFEQCQFPGDTRLMAVYHYAVFGEDRLAFKAIDDFHASRRSDGLLPCRWPARGVQLLPTYALEWVGMLDDARAWRDPDHLGRYLPAAHGVVDWFLDRLRGDGLPGRIPHAPFIDWSPGFDRGNAPQDADGGSALIGLLIAIACDDLARLERRYGDRRLAFRGGPGPRRGPAIADGLNATAEALRAAVREHCWDADRGLVADTAGRAGYSVHGQTLAIRAGLVTGEDASALLGRALAGDGLARPGSFFYWHWVFDAARLARRPDLLLDNLHRWTDSLDRHHLDTWPETDSDAPRSDCHAWSAMPVVALLRTCLGLGPSDPKPSPERSEGPDRPTFTFTPQPHRLTALSGSLPTPAGRIRVRMQRRGDRWHVDLTTPLALCGPDRWWPPGEHTVELPAE